MLPGAQKKPIRITQAEVSCFWSGGPDIHWLSLAQFYFQFRWVFYSMLSWGSTQGWKTGGEDSPAEQAPPNTTPSFVLFVSDMQKMLSHPGQKDNILLFISIIFKGASLYLFAVWLNIYYLYLIFPDSKGHH